MMFYDDTIYNTKNSISEFKALLRRMKIDKNVNDSVLKPNLNKVNLNKQQKKVIDFAIKNDLILTGSLALKVYGLLERETDDIDLKYKKSDENKPFFKALDIKPIPISHYGQSEIVLNSKGYTSKFGIKVEFFECDKNINYTKLSNGLMIDDYISIIEYKLEILFNHNRLKEHRDIANLTKYYNNPLPSYKEYIFEQDKVVNKEIKNSLKKLISDTNIFSNIKRRLSNIF